MPSIKILEKSPRKMKFLLDADVGTANALRRIMMNEVPVMAVEFVDFENNTSALFDEIIAHRLGLIPLVFDQKLFSMKSECKCSGKGCSRCEAKLSLEKHGPASVITADFKCSGVEPLDKDIPIVELLENQRIHLEATAQLGLGREHSKWQASVVGYREEKNGFMFQAESVCGLDVEDVLKTALELLSQRAEEFMKEFKKAAK